MNELSFLDLAILKKIDAESSVEKFGSQINTSFFETANLLGTIKIKGYIGIESSIGGISKVTITDAGTSILAVAEKKASDPIEPLDNAILHALAAGTKDLDALQNALNIRSGDLAYHLYKLVAQGFADYEIRSAKVSFMLTEQGFNATGGVRVQQTLVSPAEFAGEEDEEGAPSVSSPAKHAPPSDSAPPWVNPEDVEKEEHKKDVAHLLKDERHKGHGHAFEPDSSESKHKQRKPLTPEEMKRLEHHRRMVSKAHYYFHEYLPYLLLLLVVAAIFVGAIFLGLSRFT